MSTTTPLLLLLLHPAPLEVAQPASAQSHCTVILNNSTHSTHSIHQDDGRHFISLKQERHSGQPSDISHYDHNHHVSAGLSYIYELTYISS